MKDDDRLRSMRLVFYEEDIQLIDQSLDEFLELSKAKSALLIDKEGHLVTSRGDEGSFDSDTISALVAGSFAATQAMAKLLGEEEFSVLFHQGKHDNIQLSLIGDRTLLAVIFDDQTTIGMVRLYASETASKLHQLFEERAARQAAGGTPTPTLEGDFNQEAQDSLDDLFGD